MACFQTNTNMTQFTIFFSSTFYKCGDWKMDNDQSTIADIDALVSHKIFALYEYLFFKFICLSFYYRTCKAPWEQETDDSPLFFMDRRRQERNSHYNSRAAQAFKLSRSHGSS